MMASNVSAVSQGRRMLALVMVMLIYLATIIVPAQANATVKMLDKTADGAYIYSNSDDFKITDQDEAEEISGAFSLEFYDQSNRLVSELPACKGNTTYTAVLSVELNNDGKNKQIQIYPPAGFGVDTTGVGGSDELKYSEDLGCIYADICDGYLDGSIVFTLTVLDSRNGVDNSVNVIKNDLGYNYGNGEMPEFKLHYFDVVGNRQRNLQIDNIAKGLKVKKNTNNLGNSMVFSEGYYYSDPTHFSRVEVASLDSVIISENDLKNGTATVDLRLFELEECDFGDTYFSKIDLYIPLPENIDICNLEQGYSKSMDGFEDSYAYNKETNTVCFTTTAARLYTKNKNYNINAWLSNIRFKLKDGAEYEDIYEGTDQVRLVFYDHDKKSSEIFTEKYIAIFTKGRYDDANIDIAGDEYCKIYKKVNNSQPLNKIYISNFIADEDNEGFLSNVADSSCIVINNENGVTLDYLSAILPEASVTEIQSVEYTRLNSDTRFVANTAIGETISDSGFYSKKYLFNDNGETAVDKIYINVNCIDNFNDGYYILNNSLLPYKSVLPYFSLQLYGRTDEEGMYQYDVSVMRDDEYLCDTKTYSIECLGDELLTEYRIDFSNHNSNGKKTKEIFDNTKGTLYVTLGNKIDSNGKHYSDLSDFVAELKFNYINIESINSTNENFSVLYDADSDTYTVANDLLHSGETTTLEIHYVASVPESAKWTFKPISLVDYKVDALEIEPTEGIYNSIYLSNYIPYQLDSKINSTDRQFTAVKGSTCFNLNLRQEITMNDMTYASKVMNLSEKDRAPYDAKIMLYGTTIELVLNKGLSINGVPTLGGKPAYDYSHDPQTNKYKFSFLFENDNSFNILDAVSNDGKITTFDFVLPILVDNSANIGSTYIVSDYSQTLNYSTSLKDAELSLTDNLKYYGLNIVDNTVPEDFSRVTVSQYDVTAVIVGSGDSKSGTVNSVFKSNVSVKISSDAMDLQNAVFLLSLEKEPLPNNTSGVRKAKGSAESDISAYFLSISGLNDIGLYDLDYCLYAYVGDDKEDSENMLSADDLSDKINHNDPDYILLKKSDAQSIDAIGQDEFIEDKGSITFNNNNIKAVYIVCDSSLNLKLYKFVAEIGINSNQTLLNETGILFKTQYSFIEDIPERPKTVQNSANTIRFAVCPQICNAYLFVDNLIPNKVYDVGEIVLENCDAVLCDSDKNEISGCDTVENDTGYMFYLPKRINVRKTSDDETVYLRLNSEAISATLNKDEFKGYKLSVNSTNSTEENGYIYVPVIIDPCSAKPVDVNLYLYNVSQFIPETCILPVGKVTPLEKVLSLNATLNEILKPTVLENDSSLITYDSKNNTLLLSDACVDDANVSVQFNNPYTSTRDEEDVTIKRQTQFALTIDFNGGTDDDGSTSVFVISPNGDSSNNNYLLTSDYISNVKNHNYSFNYFSTDKSSMGFGYLKPGEKQYQIGDLVSITEDTTLYVIWKHYSINYNLNLPSGCEFNGARPIENNLFEDGDVWTAAANNDDFSVSGLKFVGWSLNPDSMKVDYEPGVDYIFNFGDNITLYAVWEGTVTEQTYSIKYNINCNDQNYSIQEYGYKDGDFAVIRSAEYVFNQLCAKYPELEEAVDISQAQYWKTDDNRTFDFNDVAFIYDDLDLELVFPSEQEDITVQVCYYLSEDDFANGKCYYSEKCNYYGFIPIIQLGDYGEVDSLYKDNFFGWLIKNNGSLLIENDCVMDYVKDASEVINLIALYTCSIKYSSVDTDNNLIYNSTTGLPLGIMVDYDSKETIDKLEEIPVYTNSDKPLYYSQLQFSDIPIKLYDFEEKTVDGYIFKYWKIEDVSKRTTNDPNDTIYYKDSSDESDNSYTTYSPGDDTKLVYPVGDIRITAVWEAPHKVTYVDEKFKVALNGSEFNYMTGAVVTVDGTVSGTIMTDENGGNFVLTGWQSDNDDKLYQVGDTFTMPDADVVLTAVWEKQENKTYIVTYADEKFKVALNGSEFTYEAGNTVVVMGTASGITFTDTNGDMYKLTGWLNDVDNVLYQVGESFTMPESDVTLTAQWEKVEIPQANRYTVKYVDEKFKVALNGSEFTYEAGNTVVVMGTASGITFTDTNGDMYKLTGWLSSYDNKLYQVGESFTMPESDVILTAQWEKVEIQQANRYTVKYVDEKFKVALNGSEFTYEAGNTVVVMGTASGITFTDTNGDMYKLTGWLNDVDNVLYQVGESFTMPESDVTLTAQWEKVEIPQANRYTVKYVDEKFKVALDGSEFTYEAGNTVVVMGTASGITFTDTNGDMYKLTGWLSSYDNKLYQVGESFTMPESDVTLTAQWEKVEIPQTNRYTVKYVDEKFKVALDGSEFTYEAGNTVVVMGTASGITFTDTNGDMYKLTGWLNDVDNVLYQVGESFTMPESDVTLTAQWEKVEIPQTNRYTVKY
ncbi:MAG: hypothetical protein ACI4II_00985, partial [Acutalibacteraceae bacterium]